jgi:aldehyde dehydrogenase (NAD+)
VTGASFLNRDTPGFYLSPALFKDVDNRTRIAREEIFGLVATVTPGQRITTKA